MVIINKAYNGDCDEVHNVNKTVFISINPKELIVYYQNLFEIYLIFIIFCLFEWYLLQNLVFCSFLENYSNLLFL